MSSLRELLTQEGFNRTKPKHEKLPLSTIEIKSHPLHIIHDRSKHKLDKSNTERVGLASEVSNSKSLVSPNSGMVGPPLDEVAIRAVIAILSGYIGRYVKDENFRKRIIDKRSSSLVRRRNGSESDDEILANTKLAMESIDKLVKDQGTKKELKIKSLRNSIDLLTIISSLNSKASKEAASASTCGIPNSHISACAQLYLAIVYKLQKNNRVCARHLLQVFCDSPILARTYLLPDLWERLFLPHLIHLEIWYAEELQALSSSNECHTEKEKIMKSLSRIYNNKVDTGTTMFALYYKQWLKVGANEPPLPFVSLPSRPTHKSSKRRSSDSVVLNSWI